VKPPRLICLVTDRRRLSPHSNPEDSLDRLVRFVGVAARSGVDLIQLRERDLSTRDLVWLTERCVDAAGPRARILVNDRVDVAVGARAHGVHLRADSVDPATARRLAPPDFAIGRSVHGADEAVETSRRGGVDYVIMGTIFTTHSKPAGHSPSGLETLSRVCGLVDVPVMAIGGITLDRIAAVAATGAGVAAIGLFLPPADVPVERHLNDIVKTVRRAFDTCEADS
jgi:thiamine-phosphate diphosphorylase